MSHHRKPAQSTELAQFRQLVKEKVVYGDGEFGVGGEGEGEMEYDEALERALNGEGSDGMICVGWKERTRIRVLDLHTPLPCVFFSRVFLEPVPMD